MPTGVALRDVRQQLFDAAERVLLRDGPNALTSRAVTTEAGVAKGVLHRHFTDFDAFLAELVADRLVRIQRQANALQEAAGTATVVDNLTDALLTVFGSVALNMVALITARDELRARLRRTHPTGIPILTEAADMVRTYLTTEQDLGRIAPDADIPTLALSLIGTGHMVFAGRDGEPIDADSVRNVVAPIVKNAG